ncbi:MAG: DUF1638 domain-containing protein [Bacteroidales bacterium]|nr:DUF1638 domain-containing protein [Bacteroidales bacterium]
MKKIKKTIIACGSIKAELENLHSGQDDIELKFMPQSLHRQPKKLTERLQTAINNAAHNTKMIVLGYGLCSNGTVGLKAPGTCLIIPKLHDCIGIYLGGIMHYYKLFQELPGTYYLTRNWIINQKDPLGLVNNEYTKRVGYDMAKEAMDTEIKNYKYIAFINNHTGDSDYYRNIAIENAQFFNKKFIEIEGSTVLLNKIINGPYKKKEFVILNPGEKSKQSHFLK